MANSMGNTLPGEELNDNTTVDPSVLEKLPQVKEVLSFKNQGASAWARTFRLDTELQDGSEQSYFLKVSVGHHGREALHGEFESTSTMWALAPDFVPHPIAWGTFRSIPDTHFYLCEFINLGEDLPEPLEFCEKLAQLHRHGNSPDGRFGFHVVTYNGNLPLDTSWTNTWEEYFTKSLRHMLQLNFISGGPSQELEDLIPDMFEKVIPRLLRPLETGGNSIKPSLVHGDLWCGNTGFEIESDKPLVFDACCFYAHNEYEMGDWRPERNKFGRSYFNAYQAHIPPSAPEADYDDRNALYAIHFNLNAATMFPDSTIFRKMVIDEMRRLINKFPGGFDDYGK